MEIIIDGIEFILTLVATTATTIFAVLQIYVKLKQLFLSAVRDAIRQEVDALRKEVKTLNEKYEKLEHEIRELKRSVKDRD